MTAHRVRRDAGFSLMELLIVIVLVGIATGIVLVVVGSGRRDSASTACRNDAKTITLSAQGVRTATGAYPAAAGTNGSSKLLIGGAAGALLKNWPGGSDPAADDYVFTYAQTGGGSGFALQVAGKSVAGTTAASPLNEISTAADVAAACAPS